MENSCAEIGDGPFCVHPPFEGNHLERETQHNCGIAGVCLEDPHEFTDESIQIFESLQHRGDDAFGMCATESNWPLRLDHLAGVKYTLRQSPSFKESNVLVFSTKWTTQGDNVKDGMQPFVSRKNLWKHLIYKEKHMKVKKFSYVFNGNIANNHEMRKYYTETFGHEFKTDSDTELLDVLLFYHWEGSIEKTLQKHLWRFKGGYNFIVEAQDRMIVARDPWNTHPLWLARHPDTREDKSSGKSDAYVIVASETNVFDDRGLDPSTYEEFERGTIQTFRKGELSGRKRRIENPLPDWDNPCLFEMIYFMDPHSLVIKYGEVAVTAFEFRMKVGELLAEYYYERGEIDPIGLCIADVPSSGIPLAWGFYKYLKQYGAIWGGAHEEIEKIIGWKTDQGERMGPVIERTRDTEESNRPFFPDAASGGQRSYIQRNLAKAEAVAKGKRHIVKERIPADARRLLLFDDSLIKGTTLTALINDMRKCTNLPIDFGFGFPIVKSGCESGSVIEENLLLHKRAGGSEAGMAKAVGMHESERLYPGIPHIIIDAFNFYREKAGLSMLHMPCLKCCGAPFTRPWMVEKKKE